MVKRIILLGAALTALASQTSLFGQAFQVTLTPSNYNGYNVSCFGESDGTLQVSTANGTPPYAYKWSAGPG